MDKLQLEELQLLLTAAKVLVKPPEKYYADHHLALAALVASSLKMVENALTEDVHERGLDLARAKLEEVQEPDSKLQPYEAKLASILLARASFKLAHERSDFDLREDFTPGERRAILQQYHGNNSEEIALVDAYATESGLMSMLAERLMPLTVDEA
jgi:hypothetical protein